MIDKEIDSKKNEKKVKIKEPDDNYHYDVKVEVQSNIQGRNVIKTTLYTWYDFIPKNLFK